jgi:hypothetical protein
LAFTRFGSLFLLTSSASADIGLCILSGCCSSSSLAITHGIYQVLETVLPFMSRLLIG